jgi:hypothetical protein
VIVSFHPLAERELNDAARYYDLESAGLGVAFLAEAQRCCDSIVNIQRLGKWAPARSVVDLFGAFLMRFSTLSIRVWSASLP